MGKSSKVVDSKIGDTSDSIATSTDSILKCDDIRDTMNDSITSRLVSDKLHHEYIDNSNEKEAIVVDSYRQFRTSGYEFEITSRYEIQKFLGYGAFGVVCSAMDTNRNKEVAIKKIMNVMNDSHRAKQTLREIRLMKLFHHENITKILDLIPPNPQNQSFDDLYLVVDLMETDLHRIIYSKQDLSIDHVQCFIYQIIRGLKYLHSANIIHRDLKPSNILVNANCDLKICDFGLSCLADDDNELEKTEYVVTRWYRAPEVMLKRQEYQKSIDIWSCGCILAELVLREPLFPGTNYLKQLEIICLKLGKPTLAELEFVTSDRAIEYIQSLPTNDKKLIDFFPLKYQENIELMDLLYKMLQFSPNKRLSVDDSLCHLFLEAMHNCDDEPVAKFQASFDFENDEHSNDLSEDQLFLKYRQLLWNEIRDFHPHISKLPPIHISTNSLTPSKLTINHSSTEANGIINLPAYSSNAPHDAPSSVSTIVTTLPIKNSSDSMKGIMKGNKSKNSNELKTTKVVNPMSPPTSMPSNKRIRFSTRNN